MKLATNLNRLGTETAFSVLAEAKALEAKGNPMIHLGLGQPDFKTPKHVVEAAKKALDDGHHGYVMSNGIPECRQAVTRWIKRRYNAEVDFERILIMPGGKPTMSYAIQCFGEPGAEIIHPTPAFPIYESMINYTGSTPVPYDLTEDKDLKFNPEKILSLITDKTRLLILINPNNPTGSFVEKEAIDFLAEGLKKHPHVTILSDEIYNKKIHVLHVTTKEEIDFLAMHKKNVTFETTPQHLTFYAPDCYDKLGTYAQMNPPLRTKDHYDRLWTAIKNNIVDVLGSDHAPHTKENKQKEYPNSPSGMPGVQTIFPVMLDHVNNNKLSLEQLIKLMCENPCRIFGIKNKGYIKEDFDADLTIVDMNKEQIIKNEMIASKCGWTPFHNYKVKGFPIATIVNGNIVMSEGKIISKAQGQTLNF